MSGPQTKKQQKGSVRCFSLIVMLVLGENATIRPWNVQTNLQPNLCTQADPDKAGAIEQKPDRKPASESSVCKQWAASHFQNLDLKPLHS